LMAVGDEMAKSNRRVHQLATIAGLSTVEALQRLRGIGLSVMNEHDLIPKGQQEIALRRLGIDPATGRLSLESKSIAAANCAAPPRTELEGSLKNDVREPEVPSAIESSAKKRKPKVRPERQSKREIIGHRAEVMTYLTAKDIEQIHWSLVHEFERSRDPIDPPGVRSENLLESAAFRVHTALGGELKYPTIAMAAAAYMHALISNHASITGTSVLRW
jgi:hypothetical protein